MLISRSASVVMVVLLWFACAGLLHAQPCALEPVAESAQLDLRQTVGEEVPGSAQGQVPEDLSAPQDSMDSNDLPALASPPQDLRTLPLATSPAALPDVATWESATPEAFLRPPRDPRSCA
jgi:hypothetical protein